MADYAEAAGADRPKVHRGVRGAHASLTIVTRHEALQGGVRTRERSTEMQKLLVGAFLMMLAVATPARAQGGRPVHMNIGGGFTVPVSDVADRFGTGGGFNIGVIFQPPASPVGFQ